jgi:cysteine desulfurase
MLFFSRKPERRIYLDHASATPLARDVAHTMAHAYEVFGNASALYKEGVEAKNHLQIARSNIAQVLGARTHEIIFTSGGSEGNNLAIQGIIKNYKLRSMNSDSVKKPHIITTNIEHASVLEVCRALEREDVEVTYIPVESNGVIDPKKIKDALREETILVSVMYANNEIGTIQPIREIAKVIRHFRKEKNEKLKTQKIEDSKIDDDSFSRATLDFPFFHTDACQAVNYLDINVARLGVDLMTINSSKIYGPKGIGILYVRSGIKLRPILYGGAQEFGVRAGTEPLPLITGFASAIKNVQMRQAQETERLTHLRDFCIHELKTRFSTCRINGDETVRLPNNINVSFPEFESELLVLELDAKGFAVSSKSACSSVTPDNSYVLLALGKDKGMWGTLRITLGQSTTQREIELFLNALADIFRKYKKFQTSIVQKS